MTTSPPTRRACVFVDGENFRHTLVNTFSPRHHAGDGEPLFRRENYLPKEARWSEFFDWIVEQATRGQGHRLRTYWYVIAEFDSWPPLPTKWQEENSPDEIDRWRSRNTRDMEEHFPGMPAAEVVDQLRRNLSSFSARFNGFRTIHRGISNKHDAVEFRYSGSISYNLFDQHLGREKTGDVHLAVDMMRLANSYDTAVIVSGDQDYLPVVHAVKDMGKTVVNVSFSSEDGQYITGLGSAKRLNEIADWSLVVNYETFGQFLGLLGQPRRGDRDYR